MREKDWRTVGCKSKPATSARTAAATRNTLAVGEALQTYACYRLLISIHILCCAGRAMACNILTHSDTSLTLVGGCEERNAVRASAAVK